MNARISCLVVFCLVVSLPVLAGEWQPPFSPDDLHTAIQASGIALDQPIRVEPIAYDGEVATYLISGEETGEQTEVFVRTDEDPTAPITDDKVPSSEKCKSSSSKSQASTYTFGDLTYYNCAWNTYWGYGSTGVFAGSECACGKILAGWNCYWSINTEQNEEIRTYPNSIECRYRNKGTYAYAKAFCCSVSTS